MKIRGVGTLVVFSLSLAACAVPQIDQTTAHFNEDKFHVDLNDCRGGNFAEASAKTAGAVIVGSAFGAFHGASAGLLSGDADIGALVGAAVGGTIGLGVGAAEAIERHDSEVAGCLRGKGYELLG